MTITTPAPAATVDRALRRTDAPLRRTSARTPAEAQRQRRTVASLTDRPAVVPRHVRNAVVEDHLDVANALASRYATGGRDLADLRQVAYLGLIKAADRFDCDKGDDFVAFAVATIRGEIKRHLRDHGWLVRPPRHLQEIRAAALHAEDDLAEQGAVSTPDALAARVGCTVAELRAAQSVQDDSRVVSLDLPVQGAEGVPLGQLLSYDEVGYEQVERSILLARLLDGLSARDREVLRLRFACELSQHEIGRRIGVTQMQVSRILNRLLAHLGRNLGSESTAITANG